MPTTRRRHLITETDEIGEALDLAAERWPDEASSRAALMRRLLMEGHRSITDAQDHLREARRAALARTSGTLTGLFGDDYLEEPRGLARLIVLDASVLIAHLDDTDGHHEAAVNLLFDVAEQNLSISPISLAEVLVGPARRGQLDRALAALAQLDLSTLAFEVDAPLRLALLRSSTNLKLPDCCVLLAAEKTGASVASFDEQLRRVASQLGMVVLPGD